MIIHPVTPGSADWHKLREELFTASELGPWITSPRQVNLTVPELKAELDRLGISRKGLLKREELLACLPDPEPYLTLVPGAREAIMRKLKHRVLGGIGFSDSTADALVLARQQDLESRDRRQSESNIAMKYGHLLEPYALAEYELLTHTPVTKVGFVEHDSRGFGCSPDGLIAGRIAGRDHCYLGVELKCPLPETHLSWLFDGFLPPEHAIQVHASMAATDSTLWHFMSHCPGLRPLIIPVHRDAFTDQVLAGLQVMVLELEKMATTLNIN